MHIDATGGLHPTPAGAIGESMRIESDLSRGASGACGQDPARAPGGRKRSKIGLKQLNMC